MFWMASLRNISVDIPLKVHQYYRHTAALVNPQTYLFNLFKAIVSMFETISMLFHNFIQILPVP